MNLRKGPKDPYLHSLTHIRFSSKHIDPQLVLCFRTMYLTCQFDIFYAIEPDFLKENTSY